MIYHLICWFRDDDALNRGWGIGEYHFSFETITEAKTFWSEEWAGTDAQIITVEEGELKLIDEIKNGLVEEITIFENGQAIAKHRIYEDVWESEHTLIRKTAIVQVETANDHTSKGS